MTPGVRSCCLLLCLAIAGTARSQPQPVAEKPLLFRRELLSESTKSEKGLAIIKGLMPVKRLEFEELLAATEARADGALPETWIAAADFEAALQNDVLVGKARLHVRRRPAASAARTSLLSLTGLELPISQPMWEDGDRPAIVGMNREGLLLAVVERSGVLIFDWQLQGRRDPWQALLFDLPLAEASRATLELLLPAELRLQSSAGNVVSASDSEATQESRKWNLQLSGVRDLRLRCVPDASSDTGPLVLVREENTCTVSLGELEAQCQLRLDVYREPIAELEVEILGNWQPTAIRLGDNQVPFEIVRNGTETTGTLHFDPPLSGVNRSLTLFGRAPVVEGVRTAVPRTRIKQSTWLDGSLTIQANKVQLVGWRLQELQRPAAKISGTPGHAWNLRSAAGDASFIVARVPLGLRADSGSTVRIDNEAATARVVTDFTAESAGTFQLTADVATGWIIDSLETIPPQVLSDWEITPQVSRQRLNIDLQQSIAPSQKVRVVIAAHRPPPAAPEHLGGEQLRPIRWLAAETKGCLALGVDALWQLEFHGLDRLRRLDPALLTPAEKDRLEISEDALLFADDESFDAARLALAEESPLFNATWISEISSEADLFRQQTELRIEPTSSPVERFHVLVKPPAGKALQWKLAGDDALAFEARLVRTSDDAAGEDEWEFILNRARRNPFALQATLETKSSQRYSARFMRCVEAAEQTASMELSREPKVRLLVERASGLQQLWNGDDSTARWSFDPARSAALVVRAATPQELRLLLLIRQATLESRLAEDSLVHEAIYSISNQQAQTLTLRLPADSQLDQVLVQNQRADARPSSAGQVLHIPLPASESPISVRVVYRTPVARYGATCLVHAAWPDSESIPASRSWHVLFPQSYRWLNFESSEVWTWPALWQRLQTPLPGFGSTSEPNADAATINCQRIEFGDLAGLPASLRLIHGDALGGLAWAALAICWAAIAYNRRATTEQLAWQLVGVGLIALSLPGVVDPIGRMMLLGALAGIISRQWLHSRPTAANPEQRFRPLHSSPTLATALALVMASASATMLTAQDRPARDTIHRVVFPIDAAGKPSEDYVYADRPFFIELFRRAKQPAVKGPEALLVSGVYRARPRSDARTWESLEINLVAEVLRSGTLRIPWQRVGYVIPPERIRLNGKAVPVTWNVEGTAFSLTVDAPGQCAVQFVAQPTQHDEQKGLSIQLPPVANARLVVDTLDEKAAVQVLPGPLQTTWPAEDGTVSMDLGQRTQVTLITQPSDLPPPEIEAEQLLWTNLWRGGALVEGRWRFKAANGTLPAAVVEVDGGLQLISAAALTPAAVQWLPDEDQSRVTWTPRTPSDELVVEAVFLWRGPLGERFLPRIEPQGAEVTRRWLAIDTVGTTDLVIASTPEQDEVEPAEFATLWNAEDWPQVARRINESGSILVAAPPTVTGFKYEASTKIEFGATATRFEFRAELQEVDDAAGLVRLALTPGAKLTSVEIGIAGQFRAVPWLSLASDEIALLPPDSLRVGNTIVIRGEVPAIIQSLLPPVLRNGDAASTRVELARHSDVRVELQSHTGFKPASSPTNDWPGVVRIAQLEGDGQSSNEPQPLRWTAQPNHPRTVGIFVTTLRPDGAQWIARIDAFLGVRDGVVESFDLELPASWSSLRLVAGEAVLSSTELPAGIRQVNIKPHDPTSDRYHFACEGVTSSPRVQVPIIRLLDAENVQQYVRLPRDDDYQWSTSGVQDATLPAALELAEEANFEVHRAAVPQFRVELQAEQPPLPAPRVAWGGVQVATRPDGTYLAVAHVALVPSQESAFSFSLPANARLVHAEVEGQATVAAIRGQHRLEVALRSSALPQMVRLVYAGTLVGKASENSFRLQIDDWKLDQALQMQLDSDQLPQPALADVERIILDGLNDRSPSREEIGLWAGRWTPRLRQARAAVGELSADAAKQADDLIARLQALTDQSTSPGGDDPALQFDSFLVEPRPATAPSGNGAVWLSALLGWTVIVVVGQRATQSPRLNELARRWPSWCAVLTGLGVALVLSPWIGSLLMVIAAAASLTWPWQRTAR